METPLPEGSLSVSQLLQKNMQNVDIEMLKNKKSVGMLNACLRLKMCTENHVNFEIEGEEGAGTWITIRIPMEYL